MSPHLPFSAKLAFSTSMLSLLLAVGCPSPTPAPTETAPSAEVPSSPTAVNIASDNSAQAAVTAASTTAASTTAASTMTGEVRAVSETKSAANKPQNIVKPDAKDPKPLAATEAPATTGPSKPEEPAIEKPCLATSFRFSAVQAACKKGGVPKAKSLMKAWTNQAKEKGESYKCTTCHDNQRTYSNKPNAEDDLRKLLAIIK
jgi:hypothetical protein